MTNSKRITSPKSKNHQRLELSITILIVWFELERRLDAEFINELFNTQTKIESYLQHFNVSNPFASNDKQLGKNVYAFGTAKRADGSESIVVTAPMYLAKGKNKQAPNLVGISQLFVIANLVRSTFHGILFFMYKQSFYIKTCVHTDQPYWAKNLIFVVTDVGQIGIQAWINSYYDIESECKHFIHFFYSRN